MDENNENKNKFWPTSPKKDWKFVLSCLFILLVISPLVSPVSEKLFNFVIPFWFFYLGMWGIILVNTITILFGLRGEQKPSILMRVCWVVFLFLLLIVYYFKFFN